MREPHDESMAWHRAVDERDSAFDGAFFVAITSTRIYCRPVCPSRLARRENRRFFLTQADAEEAGYRACKRCRPERAPGQASVDAVPRRATEAAARISAGDLDARSVRDLAQELRVSERHLRRAVSRALGASPFRLALAHRLNVATRLLSETRDPITFVAYSSGFRSLRRFNAAFRDRFQMSPTEWRRQLTRG
jgi:AraC family transcriptional regulator of adaptative response / DNA-3-methyladenine glycosylase II